MQNPLSIPGGWNKDTPRDTPAEERSNPGASSVPSPYIALIIPLAVDTESVPRSGVGVVSDAGDVVDEAGKTVGKVADSKDPKELAGNTVTAAGDIVSTTGDVLGKAVPLDEEPSEYTTASAEKPKKSSGFGLSGLRSVYKTVDGTMKPVTSRLGFGSRSGSNITPEDKSPSQGEETERQFREAQGKASSSEINLKDEDPVPSDTGKKTGLDNDKLTEVPPDPVETTKEAEVEAEQSNSIKPDDLKPDDSVSRFEPESTSEIQKDIPPVDEVQETQTTDPADVPKSDALKSVEGTDVTKPEVPKSEVPEGSELDKTKPEVPESEVPKSEIPEGEVPKSEIPEGEVPKSEIPEGEVPKSEIPEGEVPKSEIPEGEVPKSEIPEGEVPKSEIPEDEVPKSQVEGSEVAKTQVEGSEIAKSEVPEPEIPKSEIPESEIGKSEVPESQIPKSDAPPSDIQPSELDKSEVAGSKAPGSDVPESEAPKSVVSGMEIPKSVAPEGEIPEGEVPEGELPECEVPKGELPEGELPEGEVPKSEAPEGKIPEEEAEDEHKLDFAALQGCVVNKGGNLINDKGELIGRVVEGEVKQLIGKKADADGVIWNDAGKAVGKGEPLPDNEREDLKDFAPFENFPGAVVEGDGRVLFEGKQVGQVIEGDPKRLKGSKVDEDGDILDRRGNVIGKAEAWDEPEPEEEEAAPEIDYSILAGKRVNKAGNVVGDDGILYGRVIEGHIGSLVGRMCDKEGNVRSESGEAIGRVELVPEDQRQGTRDGPFADLVGCTVVHDGKIATSTGEIVGRLIEGDAKALYGRPIDEDGDILDRNGNTIGKAERWEEPEAEAAPEVDYSILAGKRVNKAGNVVGSNGELYGRVIEGHIGSLVGRMCDKEGNIRSESGDIIGRAELVPEDQREATRDGPFADLDGCTVARDGKVATSSGEIVGRLTEGDAKALYGRPVDEDGDILDKNGNVIGKAERWEEPEEEPEAAVDYSSLSGKRVNKAGNVVSSNGDIYGRVVEGHIGSVIGRMCDKDGNIRSESGEIIGRAELVGEGQREGTRDGPFAELVGCTVTKEGKVITATGDVVGRLVSGDPKVLYGRGVDEDGDILDKNGNVIGKAERWEEAEVEKKKDPLAGRRVNREGNVVDEDGNIIGKLTSGDLFICSGKEVDEDGDVINQKGESIGHVSRLEDIPEPEAEPEPEPEVETETPEEKEAREQLEKDVKLAGQIAACVEQTLDKIRPICKMITDKVDTAERTPKEELDEEELVKQVKPLIEEGGKILTEVNGAIRGLDPDGRIQRNAKAKAASREATPEEAHLAEVLKELTGTITTCIENAKKKIDGMPHAKEELNPLWGLLAEPLFQILAAVGLLLNGVLGLVGRLLSIVGLGGVVDAILGGLGVNKILKSLGLGSAITALTGKKEKKK